MAQKQDVEKVEYAAERRGSTGSKYEANVARRGSLSSALDNAVGGNRRGSVRDLDYVDHLEGDDRAEAAKGKDSAGFNNQYWYSANFIGTLLAIGFSFMAGIGGSIDPRERLATHKLTSTQVTA